MLNQPAKVVEFVTPALNMSEGDGAEVQRLFPLSGRMMNYDPFVLWDHFSLEPGTGFPTHPHRGFEAITYMFNGSMEHRDNLGNASTVFPGGAQRFTAGRGIEHSEMPGGDGFNSGIQLWINLPQRLKSIEPGYQQANQEDIPRLKLDNGEVAVIVGDDSPVKLHTPVRYLDVTLKKTGHFSQQVPAGFRGLIYMVQGAISVSGTSDANSVQQGQALFFDYSAMQAGELVIEALQDSRFMLCMGQPHNEPIRQWGPFVD